MQILYSFLLYLIIPLVPLYLKYRSKKNPAYNDNWSERFTYKLQNPSTKPIIWVHAVSVGETRAIAKLVDLLTYTFPNYQLLLTQMTPTGRDTAQKLYPQAIVHYIPYDLPHMVANFYACFKPQLGLIVETEIWPNLIHFADKTNIPLLLINARLSLKSFTGYYKFRYFITPVLNKLPQIICQNQDTLDRFVKLGYTGKLACVGSTKFDLELPETVINQGIAFFKDSSKKVVVFASTRDGEDELILKAIPHDLNYLLVIIPRHPERFSIVESLIRQKNLIYQKRSDNEPLVAATQVFLGDSIGEMFMYFAGADIAVVGGSFKDYGSHNPLEPIFMQIPTIIGPSIYNFATITKDAADMGAILQVNNIAQCFAEIAYLFSNNQLYQQLVNNCSTFINRYQGASAAIINLISPYLEKPNLYEKS